MTEQEILEHKAKLWDQVAPLIEAWFWVDHLYTCEEESKLGMFCAAHGNDLEKYNKLTEEQIDELLLKPFRSNERT